MVQGLENLEISGRVETSKLSHYWDRPEYLEEPWRLEETCHSNSRGKLSGNAGVKTSQISKIIIIIIIIRVDNTTSKNFNTVIFNSTNRIKNKMNYINEVLVKNKSLLTIVSKVGDLCRGWPEGSLFDSYHTKM